MTGLVQPVCRAKIGHLVALNRKIPWLFLVLCLAGPPAARAEAPAGQDELSPKVPGAGHPEPDHYPPAFDQSTNVVTEAQMRADLESAAKGDARAQYRLARLHAAGHGVTLDPGEAARWCQQAAEAGLADAQNYWGWMLANGFGVSTNTVEAVKWYKKAANQGSAEGLANLGYCYLNGIGIAPDLAEGIRLYRVAAEAGSPEAMANLGLEYEKGAAVPKDEAQSFAWEQKAAMAGLASSQFIVARVYFDGLMGVEKNPSLGLEWLTKAAAQNNPDALLLMAVIKLRNRQLPEDLHAGAVYAQQAALAGSIDGEYMWAELQMGYHGLPINRVEARKWLVKAAQDNSGLAQFKLGILYLSGSGGEHNPALAFKWVKAAASQGDPMAVYQLGILYKQGVGTPTNLVEAFKEFTIAANSGLPVAEYELALAYNLGAGTERDESLVLSWTQRAASAGWPEAETTLGRMYRAGDHGLTKDMAEAMVWLLAGANGGDAAAQFDLGSLLVRGSEVPLDETNAVKWFARAAKQGNVAAENCYGYALGRGIGTTADPVQAFKWLLLAVRQKNPDALANLPPLQSTLTDDQIEAGKALASAFKPKPEIPAILKLPGLDDLLK